MAADFEDTGRLRAIEARLDRGSERMDLMQTELQTNTRVTAEVRDILEAARGFFRFAAGAGRALSWIGRIAAAGVAIWGAVYAATHGGKPPGA